jgi:hypothetical protein
MLKPETLPLVLLAAILKSSCGDEVCHSGFVDHDSEMRCDAVQCDAVQCDAVQCDAMHRIETSHDDIKMIRR